MTLSPVSPVRSDDEPDDGTALLELPPLRVVPAEPAGLFAGPVRPPCTGDDDAFRAHADDRHQVDGIEVCDRCDAEAIAR